MRVVLVCGARFDWLFFLRIARLVSHGCFFRRRNVGVDFVLFFLMDVFFVFVETDAVLPVFCVLPLVC